MKQITLHSDRYPGLATHVLKAPGTDKPGSVNFAVDIPYTVADETAAALVALLDSFEERVSRHYRLTIADLTPPSEVAGDVTLDVTPVEINPTEVTLTEDDEALIEIEVAKLKGLTVAQAIPIVQNTATNEELPVALRRAYLNAVIATRNAKAIDAKASELLEQLA